MKKEPVLPITDNSILAALGSNDDGLPEDLLQHVAELAEHKELQEILDKQVLGVIGTDNPITAPPASLPTPSTPVINPIPITQQMQPSTPTHSTPSSSTNPESLPTMTVKEQLMPRKEAIQIRRSDGRIITLPPIEAPATRSAKRRAQAGSSSSAATTPVSAASHTTTAPSAGSTPSTTAHHPKSSKQSTKVNTVSVSYDDGSGSLMIDESRSKGNRSGTSSRRTSESSSTSGRGKRQSAAAVAAAVATVAEDDAESDESWNSEDDPDRLWCICMQPHNNRFMICCDTCEEWFHGKCVNVTKAMGQQMEEDGVEWSCPNCSKKKQEKQQPKMTEFLVSSSSSNVSIGGTLTTTSSTVKVVAISMAGCVVCGKPSRTNSVYCSDECIRKHAGMANSSVATTTPLSSTATSHHPTYGRSSSVTKDKQNEHIPKKHEPLALPKGNAKAGPIIVMERKTGRCITGKNAPTAENLKEWLAAHPSFEVVPPGSPQAAIILAKQAEARKQQMANEAQKKPTSIFTGAKQSPTGGQHGGSSKVQSQIKITDQRKLTLASPARQQQQQHGHHSKPPVKTFSRVSAGTPTSKAMTSGTKPATVTSKGSPHSSAGSTPNSSSSEHGGKHQKKPASEPKPAPKPVVPAGENIRVTVKKTLKEHLAQRTSEMSDKDAVRLTDEEIEKFVAEIEEEMFALFNKDTGAKYRAKYRSLVFNIKDRKNLSLFQKICEKRIEAKQLVRMTPEELASQELAQWRENENKHQLEMIKKSELDLLACAKNYVLKTHKGEEVIEGKRDDRLQLDPTTSVEDVVAVLNNSTVSSTSEVDSTLSPSKDNYRKDYDFHGKYSTGLYGSGPITSSTLSGAPAGSATASSPSTATSSATKKKESRRSRSRSRSHDRHKDRSRSRSKHKRRRSRSHDRHSSRSRDRDRHHRDHKSDHHKSEHKSEHHKSDHKSEHHHKKHDSRDSREKSVTGRSKEMEASSSVSSEKDKNEALGKSVDAGKQPKKVDSKPQTQSFNLVDQILGSAGSSSGAKTEEPTEKDDKPVQEESKPVSAEQDQEPTSTVTIPTPPHSTSFDSESPTNDFASTSPSSLSDDDRKKALFVHWTGNVHMIDVASVEMSIRSVSGDVDDVMKEFPEDLNICGTIKPEMVWEYVGQIKKSINREICLVRFHSNESAAYYTLYSHLISRKRCSVITSPTPAIKDFYICPLPSGQMIPMILKPLRGIGIIEGDKKPDLLLGIIVKVKGKHSSTTMPSGTTMSAKTPRRQTKVTASSSGSSAVSPAFALMRQEITKYATVNKKALVTDPKTAVDSTPPSSPGSIPPSKSSATIAAPAVSNPEPKISRTLSESSDHMDVDMDIIKAPIVPKAAPVKEPIAAVVIDDDEDDEPYSPGGGSNDSDHFADVTAIVETKNAPLDSESDRIRREMEEINRKIAEEKSEIVGIINKAELKEDEIKSTLDPSLITDIAIPSNLSEILASIKSTPSTGSDIAKGKEPIKSSTLSASVPMEDDEDEYVPTSVYSSYKSGYGYGASKPAAGPEPIRTLTASGSSTGTSRLANLSEAELLSMVPDDSYLQASSTRKSAAIPVVELDSDDSIPPPKKASWDASEPPPPGVETDMDVE